MGRVQPDATVGGMGAMDFDRGSYAGGVEIAKKGFVGGSAGRGAMFGQLGVVEGVGIDGDDWSFGIVLRHHGQHHRGFSFEAADLDDGAQGGCAGRGKSQEARLGFGKKAGQAAGGAPRAV